MQDSSPAHPNCGGNEGTGGLSFVHDITKLPREPAKQKQATAPVSKMCVLLVHGVSPTPLPPFTFHGVRYGDMFGVGLLYCGIVKQGTSTPDM